MALREGLGDLSSIVCFRALVVGIEDALGPRAAMVSLKAAGRKRGHDLVASLGMEGKGPANAADGAKALDAALGPDGTRLCRVDDLTRDGDTFVVKLSETICSAGEPPGSERRLTFTFGAIHGALESLYGTKLKGVQTGSVLDGGSHDEITFTPR